MSKEIEDARRAYDVALHAILDAKAGKHNGLERAYGLTYQRLVRLGAAQQIKRKYRGI